MQLHSMGRFLAGAAIVCCLIGGRAVAKEPALASGIDKAGFDTSVKPGDDFFQYVNGNWIKNNPIPAE
jgi:putative endopeptidase